MYLSFLELVSTESVAMVENLCAAGEAIEVRSSSSVITAHLRTRD